MTTNMDLRDDAYRQMQELLLCGDLVAGARISEQGIADRLGVSRTPVREAIARLAEDGLAERLPRSGTVIRTPGPRQLRELYEVREALEALAAGQAVRQLDRCGRGMLEATLRHMEQALSEARQEGRDRLSGAGLRRYLDADISFHMLLVRAAGSHAVMETIRRFRVVQRLWEYERVDHSLSFISEALAQHQRILDSLRAGDGPGARDLMAAHIRFCAKQSLLACAPAPSEALAPPDLPADLLAQLLASRRWTPREA